MSMTVLAPIPIWFVCKLCRGLYHEIDKFVKHEKEIHSVDFASVKCIIFEVTAAVINHNQDLPPEFSKILNDQEEPSLSRSSYLERLDKLTQDIFSQRIQYEYETLSAGAGQHRNHTLATAGSAGSAPPEEIQDNQQMETMKMDVSPAEVVPYEFGQDIKMGRQLHLTETEAYVSARSGSESEPDPLGPNEEIATSLLPFTDGDESSCSGSVIIKHESELEPVSISYFEFNDSENEWRLGRPKEVKDQKVILENEERKPNREDGNIFARKRKIKSKSPFNPYVLLKRLSPTEIQSALDGKSSELDPEPGELVKCLQMVSASTSGPSNSEIISTQTHLGQHMELMHGNSSSSSGSSHKRPQNKYARKYITVPYPSKGERQYRTIKKKTSVPTMQSEVRKQTTVNEFLCEICGKVFSARTCLENHNLLVHTENRPYKCKWENCRATFPTEIEFNQHEVMIHRKIIEKFRRGLLTL